MVGSDRIRAYAQDLQYHPAFLTLVLSYIASSLQDKIINSPEATNESLDFIPISQRHITHLDEYLAEDLHDPKFLEFCATNILEQLEDWNATGERPDNLGPGIFATGYHNPTLSGEAAMREAEVRDRFAPTAANILIKRLGLLQLNVALLDELLGFKTDREKIKVASKKLSQMQKRILLELLEQTHGYRYPVPWVPSAWFGELNNSKRTAISHALKQLEGRGLLRREASKNEGQSLRTALVAITELGYLCGKRLQKAAGNSQLQ